MGTCLSRGSHRAFPGPQTKHGKRVCHLSFPVLGMRATGKLSGNNSQSGSALETGVSPVAPDTPIYHCETERGLAPILAR